MSRIFKFVRSELFLSLAGGFALGVAGLAIVKPASADVGYVNVSMAISVGAPINETTQPAS